MREVARYSQQSGFAAGGLRGMRAGLIWTKRAQTKHSNRECAASQKGITINASQRLSEPDVVPKYYVTERCAESARKQVKAFVEKGARKGSVVHIPSPSNGVNPAIDDIKTMFPCAKS